MTTSILPTKLRRAPLVDAVFEMRFRAAYPISNILPGMLFPKLGPSNVERLPIADLPQAVRHADQNFRYSPLVRMTWGRFLVLIGDYSIGLACTMPYPGWQSFKGNILELLSFAGSAMQDVERYSLKYLDIITQEIGSPSSVLNMQVVLGSHRVNDESFLIRVEIPRHEALHVLQLTSNAHAVLADGKNYNGLVLDIDSIVMTPGLTFPQLETDFSAKLERLHEANKAVFFDCLQPQALEKLEPEYA